MSRRRLRKVAKRRARRLAGVEARLKRSLAVPVDPPGTVVASQVPFTVDGSPVSYRKLADFIDAKGAERGGRPFTLVFERCCLTCSWGHVEHVWWFSHLDDAIRFAESRRDQLDVWVRVALPTDDVPRLPEGQGQASPRDEALPRTPGAAVTMSEAAASEESSGGLEW